MRLNMTSKITVVVDLDDTEMLEEHGSLERGVYGVDRDGVYHMYYSSKTYLVSFSPQIELSSEKLDTGYTCEYCSAFTCNCEEINNDYNKSYDNAMQMKKCEYCGKYECNCEQIIDKNIQAQERTGQQ